MFLPLEVLSFLLWFSVPQTSDPCSAPKLTEVYPTDNGNYVLLQGKEYAGIGLYGKEYTGIGVQGKGYPGIQVYRGKSTQV